MKPSRFRDNRLETLALYRGGLRKSASEQTLRERWHAQHEAFAGHDLAGKYLHRACKIAEGYGGCGIPIEELIGEGYVGLMRAVCRFDPYRGLVSLHTRPGMCAKQSINL